MFPRIVLATNRSQESAELIGCVQGLRALGTENAVLVYCVPLPEDPGLARSVADFLGPALEKQRERLQRLKKHLLAKGATDVRIEIPYGSPTQEILRRCRTEDVSLVVMGTQGRGFTREVFLGSVSHNVARKAPISVLLVPAAPSADA